MSRTVQVNLPSVQANPYSFFQDHKVLLHIPHFLLAQHFRIQLLLSCHLSLLFELLRLVHILSLFYPHFQLKWACTHNITVSVDFILSLTRINLPFNYTYHLTLIPSSLYSSNPTPHCPGIPSVGLFCNTHQEATLFL